MKVMCHIYHNNTDLIFFKGCLLSNVNQTVVNVTKITSMSEQKSPDASPCISKHH